MARSEYRSGLCYREDTRSNTSTQQKFSLFKKIAYYLKRNLLQKHSVEICSIQQSPFTANIMIVNK
ncbi:hypothetical protein SM94_05134 [Klebsiella pneumoniae]|jgi:hypothetical protein|nr:hypothetical protein SM94_05134 [Klebsiella pneumoniae]